MSAFDTHGVLQEVAAERQRQISKGWTPDHDDSHSTHRMVELAAGRLLIRQNPDNPGYLERRRLIEGIAILVAAVEAWDRREAGDAR